MTQDTEPTRSRIFWSNACTFAICVLVLSRLYGIAVASLSNWGLISIDAALGLFEKHPLLIAHFPLVLFSVGIACIFGRSVRNLRASRIAAIAWTSTAISGHVLTVVFC